MTGSVVITFDDWRSIVKKLPPPPADAWAEGTRVRRNEYSDGGVDTHTEGAMATVRLRLPASPGIGPAYVVEWDDLPGLAVLVVGKKLERVH